MARFVYMCRLGFAALLFTRALVAPPYSMAGSAEAVSSSQLCPALSIA
jgi:hypothetical protein